MPLDTSNLFLSKYCAKPFFGVIITKKMKLVTSLFRSSKELLEGLSEGLTLFYINNRVECPVG